VIDEPNFAGGFPRVRLAALPTPLERAVRLEAALRDEGGRPPLLYIKRDDLLGLALGGNKIRNLEFSLGAAIADGATDIVTVGRAQSNHCRLTAAACAKVGLRAHLVMTGARPAVAQGNLLLSELFGASVLFCGADDRAARETMAERVCEEIVGRGGRPVLLPVGGSDARGAIGHAVLAHELVVQCDAAGERAVAIVLATATGGTQAGLLAGFHRAGGETRVIGFSVHKPATESRADVLALGREVARMIGSAAAGDGDVIVDDSQLGAGYGVPSAAGNAAVAMLARTEGIAADPVYTGKALAGVLAMTRAGSFNERECVVFIHTGGTPASFADLPATSL
jgi:1-aminocyclopropane-1-carboxylate deaminase/D-cysteine desulfhydrase-like pyridoxal-dependent ACC family enzyme